MRYYDEPIIMPVVCMPPTMIKINVPPNKLVYEDGESIDLTGAVVQAYVREGILWQGYYDGVIPHSELTVTPSTAEYNGDEYVVEGLTPPVYLRAIYNDEQFGYFESGGSQYYYYIYGLTSTAPVYCYRQPSSTDTEMIVFVSKESFSFGTRRTHPWGWNDDERGWYGTLRTYMGYSAYIAQIGTATPGESMYKDLVPRSAQQSIDAMDAAVLAVNTGTPASAGGEQEITVSWDYEGTTLSDTFDITVGA